MQASRWLMWFEKWYKFYVMSVYSVAVSSNRAKITYSPMQKHKFRLLKLDFCMNALC